MFAVMRFNTCNYTVEIDLQSAEFCLHQNQINILKKQLQQIGSKTAYFADICSLRNGILRYESESIFPARPGRKKQKVMLVLGNPSLLSVKNGMFFYSREDGGRHGFWGKLAKAGLVRSINKESRRQEAEERRNMLFDDRGSTSYTLGLTTFYSFPTPGSDQQKFSGSAGVEKLFEPILKQIHRFETRRLLSYPFIDGAILVFTRKSSLKRFYKITGIKPAYWPTRGEDSGGEELAQLLTTAGTVNLEAKSLLF